LRFAPKGIGLWTIDGGAGEEAPAVGAMAAVGVLAGEVGDVVEAIAAETAGGWAP
jgi:hypothetical protein